MISSGLNTPAPVIPMPAFEVPYAAPTASRASAKVVIRCSCARTAEDHLGTEVSSSTGAQIETRTADVTPAKPKNGANGGHSSDMLGIGEKGKQGEVSEAGGISVYWSASMPWSRPQLRSQKTRKQSTRYLPKTARSAKPRRAACSSACQRDHWSSS
jgi:hypothetical protein